MFLTIDKTLSIPLPSIETVELTAFHLLPNNPFVSVTITTLTGKKYVVHSDNLQKSRELLSKFHYWDQLRMLDNAKYDENKPNNTIKRY